MMKMFKCFLAGFLFIAFETLHSAHAATITVNSTDDTTAADGKCTLREAIEAANTNAAVNECPKGDDTNAATDRDVIDLSGLTGTITLTSTLPLIIQSVEIKGPGARDLAISGNNDTAILGLLTFANAAQDSKISGLTLEKGVASEATMHGDSIIEVVSGKLLAQSIFVTDNQTDDSTGSQVIFGCNHCKLTVDQSLISGNRDVSGDVIFDVFNHGSLTLVNSTVTNNPQTVFSNSSSQFETVTVVNSTITENEGGIAGNADGIYNIFNSIILQNTGPDCSPSTDTLTLNTFSHSIIGTLTNCVLPMGATQVAGDPMLGPLQDNGGPTDTRALSFGSPAIDVSGACTDNNGQPVLKDQRGFDRPVNVLCDIGAFESNCGNGTVETLTGEACDDGNTTDGDGCSSTCTVEPGFACGDGTVAGTEACDDGNTTDGDGCSVSCSVELGFTCPATGGACKPNNGNNIAGGGNTEGSGCALNPAAEHSVAATSWVVATFFVGLGVMTTLRRRCS